MHGGTGAKGYSANSKAKKYSDIYDSDEDSPKAKTYSYQPDIMLMATDSYKQEEMQMSEADRNKTLAVQKK